MRIVLFLVFLALLTTNNWANADTSLNCVSLNHDINNIASLKTSGKYRQLMSHSDEHTFDFSSNAEFSQYLRYARKQIEQLNPKASLPCPLSTTISQHLSQNNILTVADFVAPYQADATDEKAAILLIHGLTDSPYLFHDLTAYFNRHGITVRTLLLPGHGTAPEALINVDKEEWRAATSYAIQKMFDDFEAVYLGGFSTGGALIIDYLNHQPLNKNAEKLKGVMLWSPASEAKSAFAWAAQFLSWFKDYLDVGADIDFAKYESFPTNAAAQVKSLMDRISIKKLKRLPDIPVLTVASDVDQTINTESTLKLIRHWHNQKSAQNKALDSLIYYSRDISRPLTPDSLNVYLPSNCNRANYCSHIIDVAHTATTNAPSNPHYGWKGHYRNCEIHLTQKAYKACKLTDDPLLGEISKQNLLVHSNLQRLTFNPYFQEMTDIVTDFIHKTL